MQPFQILLVEDNPGDVYLFKLALTRAGLAAEVIHLADGEVALSYVRREPPYHQSQLPDLAVLDMNLPKRTGAEVLEAMRLNPEFAHIPVVMMSSSALARDQASKQERAHTQYLTKPSDLAEFLHIGGLVKQILVEARDHRGAESGA